MKRLIIPRFALLAILTLLSVMIADCTNGEEWSERQSPPSVTLPLSEYESLFSEARVKAAERRLQDDRQSQQKEHERALDKLQQERQTIQQEQARQQEQSQRLAALFPDNYQVLEHRAKGIYDASLHSNIEAAMVASFDIGLTVRVLLESNWTVIPIVNVGSAVTSDWQVKVRKEEKPSSGFQESQLGDDPHVLLHVREGQQTLATNQSGVYHISYRSYARVAKARSVHSVALSSIMHPLTDFSFRILTPSLSDEESDEPTTATRIIKDVSAQPASAVLKAQSFASHTDIDVKLPLDADNVQIKWLDIARTDASIEQSATNESAAQKPDDAPSRPQVTATHQVLHSIEEGSVQSTHTLEFTANTAASEIGESLDSVEFLVHGGTATTGLRVTSVSGLAVESWSLVDQRSSAVHAEHNATDSGLLVQVALKRAQADKTILLDVQTEMDWAGGGNPETDGEKAAVLIGLPSITCIKTIRQTGSIAVVKDANVEVHEASLAERKVNNNHLVRCDANELPSRLRLNTHSRPIVMSYKYMQAGGASLHQHRGGGGGGGGGALFVQVMQHAALETLEASVDRLHYKAVVTDTHIVHSATLVVQHSTTLQYLKLLDLPTTAGAFTVSVNTVPAKPVQARRNRNEGASNSILVPLLVGSSRGGRVTLEDSTSCLKTSIELSYISRHDDGSGGVAPLSNRISTASQGDEGEDSEEVAAKNATISLAPPGVDLPISVLTVHLSLPLEYNYTFGGDFGTKPSDRLAYAVPKTFSHQTGKRVVPGDYEFSHVDDFLDRQEEQQQSGAVKVVTPTRSGVSAHFHRLLVMDPSLKLDVTFSAKQQIVEPKVSLWPWPFSG